MVAIRSAKCASDIEEDAEAPEVTGSGPPQEGQCMEGTGKQDDLNDAPMTDAGSVDPVDVASEDLGADSSATDDP
eukprot:4756860-Lingulodinium_polyedra.AAC.1